MSGNRLAIVDDEQDICDLFSRIATECGFDVFSTTSPHLFLDHARGATFDVIILDLNMPGVDGIELLRELAALASQAQIVLASGVDDKVMEAAVRLGRERNLDMAGVIRKPMKLNDLRDLLQGLAPKGTPAVPAVPAGEVTYADLAQAISRKELVLHYQPMVNLATRRIVGVEALMRWQHPTLGLLAPVMFLPLAESTGLIIPITDWLYDTAIDQCGRWRRDGFDLCMSLNLSAKLPFEYDMPERIAAVCEKNFCHPEMVNLELTETAAMADPVRLIDVFTRLRIKGFGLSIDDFGTAYSSLIQLQRLPFTEMKIDKSFVMTMLQSNASMVIVETIIAMAHSMRMKAVAEGVESAEVLAALVARKCDLAQGYFLSRPVPADRIPDLCRASESAGQASAA